MSVDLYYQYPYPAPPYVIEVPPPEATSAYPQEPPPATIPPNQCYAPKTDSTGNVIKDGNPHTEFKLQQNLQPIYKLHGSINWRDDAGEILVMGGAKEGIIKEKKILSWYREEFERILTTPDTRLMVIGYGFRDRHIDEIIYSAWKKSGLRMFIVHPAGLQALEKQAATQIRVPDPLTEIPSLGESTRLLQNTFAGDHAELENLLDFFKG